jgi:hypothetical protein
VGALASHNPVDLTACYREFFLPFIIVVIIIIIIIVIVVIIVVVIIIYKDCTF